MIRDPSDGSVSDLLNSRATAAQPAIGIPITEQKPIVGPILDTTTSGLPTGSSKPENIARLEKSREWLKEYFHRKTEGT